MVIPQQIIDNSEENKLVTFLNDVLKETPDTNLDIATAFFNIQAYAMLRDNLDGVKRFRLLLGRAPEIKNENTLGNELLKVIEEEVEGFELTKEKEDDVKHIIKFLGRNNVEVRIYAKQFLHGKTYIFDRLVVIGSSNFTASGLTYNTELNAVSLESQARYTREQWFEKFWGESKDFKDDLVKLLKDSRFGSKEYDPYTIYIKALYELQREDLKAEEEKQKTGLPPTKVNLAEFQADAIQRIFTRLKKYNSILVADSVGLGKTWIAKKVLEKIGYYERKSILIICPAQLREMWRKEMKTIDVKENILSLEALATEDFLKKAKVAVGGALTEIELIVVDESHNLRNPLSNRWENFFTLVNENISRKGYKPYILFLTATPINNTIWDLYWQLMLMLGMERRAMMKENILDLFTFFKEVEKQGDPSMLNDLLNEISIRRTRDYIIKNYKDAYILKEQPDGTLKEQKIVFPKRELENIDYKLDETYQGMYKEISDTITEKLKMAYYKILQYKKTEKLTIEEEMVLGRMIAIGGIFRTILLKRLESSVDAFRISVSRHIRFLTKLKKHLNEGKLLTKESFNKYLMRVDEEIEDYIEKLEDFKPRDYKMDELLNDIDVDIKLLNGILDKVKKIKTDHDAKLNVLKEKLQEFSEKGQVIVFTYYADTLEYIYKEISGSKEFSNLKIEAISSSGKKTGKSSKRREEIIKEFFDKKINILMSTDVLSEGQNLQTAQYLINYDLHWNPTRMIQRAGRIDRIGSPFKKIFVYNFFPEDELEELLKLVEILQTKIIDIDRSIGLDQTILGEKVHPKVFGIIRKIRDKDKTILDELERDVYGGGERFYQPLKDFLKKKGIEELESLPNGIHSGLKKKFTGIFFYYRYDKDFHFWYLYDVNSGRIIENRTQIIDFIECPPEEARIIPDFFEKVYEINTEILQRLERSYKEIEQKQMDPKTVEYSKDKSTTFINKMVKEIELQINEYLEEFPEEKHIEQVWDKVKDKLLSIPHTKKRLKELRTLWRTYKKDTDWKNLIKELNNFLIDKGVFIKEKIPPFDKGRLKLIVVDFIS